MKNRTLFSLVFFSAIGCLAIFLFFSAETSEYKGTRYRGDLLVPILGVHASSERTDVQQTYYAHYLVDQTWRSWAEGSAGNGIGESFTLTFAGSETIAGFALKNGNGHLDYYGKNNRVKAFTIYFDEKDHITIPIKDSISFEQYAFGKIIACKSVRFVIDDIYPGTDFNNTCVSEIAFLRRTLSDREFYENILLAFAPPEERGDYDILDGQFKSNPNEMVSISDTEKMILYDYLPFDYSGYERKTNVAVLNDPPSLQLHDNLPRLDGATAMYPLYSSFVRAVYPEFEGQERYTAYHPNAAKSIVQCNTTSWAYQRLIDGEADIVICYEPSKAEKNAAAEKGKQFNLTPIANDAFVFIVNDKNVLSSITQQQIRDIYSGRITNWKTISGVDEPVIAYQRPENSGSQTTLQSIMKEDKLMRPILEGEFVPSGMMLMIHSVASNYYNYNSAIGYSFLFYLKIAGSSGIKVLAVDGVMPSKLTIQNGSYPFAQTVYAVTTGNESKNTKKFIDWMLSAQGQELAEKTGYLPVR
ncbi:MAG: substrate-binding domain-containing protein [Treponema sp.]|nr:substrate-binding domain-containing protein [Treponema sp.]